MPLEESKVSKLIEKMGCQTWGKEVESCLLLTTEIQFSKTKISRDMLQYNLNIANSSELYT